MRQWIAYSFLLLLYSINLLKATSIALPEWETFGRASPLILVAKIEHPVQYELIDAYSYRAFITYTVVSVEKNIISDFEITDGQLIRVQRGYDMFDYPGKTVSEVIELKSKPEAQSHLREQTHIVCLTLNASGGWRFVQPLISLEYESRYEEMDAAGLFAPVGIDGIEAEYTIDEWQDIVNAGIARRYYELDFADPRPAHWPMTFDGAVSIAVDQLKKKQRVSLYSNTSYDSIYDLIGLSKYQDGRDELILRNKMLLKEMGRIDPRYTRLIITDEAEEIVFKGMGIFDAKAFGQYRIERINFEAKSLDEAVTYIFSQSGLEVPHTLKFDPNTQGLKVNISLRGLEAWRCLQFVLNQANCGIDVSLDREEPLTFFIYSESRER